MPIHIRTYGKLVFFDRSIIRTNWSRINRGPLQRAGMIVRGNARSSIRRVRRPGEAPSRPGRPPKSRRPGATPPFKMIYSVPDVLGTSVMVGMVWFGSWPPVPGLHELGGYASRTVRTLTGFTGGNRHRPVFSHHRVRARYTERPFMFPALQRAVREGKLPSLWRNSVSSSAA